MSIQQKPVDRRVKRSRKMLQDALLELLVDKEYQKITISEITKHADVARTTFYAHFDSKEDLLLSCIDNIFEAFFDRLREKNLFSGIREPVHQIPLLLALEWKKNKAMLDRIRSVNVDCLILQRMRAIQTSFYPKEAQLVIGTSSNPVLEQYLEAYASAATHAILIQWTNNGMKESPEAIAKLIINLFQKESLDRIRENFDIQ